MTTRMQRQPPPPALPAIAATGSVEAPPMMFAIVSFGVSDDVNDGEVEVEVDEDDEEEDVDEDDNGIVLPFVVIVSVIVFVVKYWTDVDVGPSEKPNSMS